jgi:hypothetical protein
MTETKITEQDIQIAAQVLSHCAANDPWFPQPNRATAIAWAEHIARWKIALPDAIEGVSKMYGDNGAGFRPLPKDFVDAARFVRAKRCQDESDAERQAREDRSDRALEERNKARLQLMIDGSGFGKAIDA